MSSFLKPIRLKVNEARQPKWLGRSLRNCWPCVLQVQKCWQEIPCKWKHPLSLATSKLIKLRRWRCIQKAEGMLTVLNSRYPHWKWRQVVTACSLVSWLSAEGGNNMIPSLTLVVVHTQTSVTHKGYLISLEHCQSIAICTVSASHQNLLLKDLITYRHIEAERDVGLWPRRLVG